MIPTLIGFAVTLGYLFAGIATGRSVFLSRVKRGEWGTRGMNREDTMIAVALAISFWPLFLPIAIATRPPKPSRQERIEKLEKELNL